MLHLFPLHLHNIYLCPIAAMKYLAQIVQEIYPKHISVMPVYLCVHMVT